MQKAAPGLTDFVYAPLVSTGMRSPGNPTMYDDAIGIREVIRPLVEAGKRLVLNGEAQCRDPDNLLFHDVDKDVATIYQPLLKCQPAEGWVGKCTYCGWEKVPSSYLLTEHDRVLSPRVQEICAGISGSEVIRIPAGHLPMLSDPKMLAEKVVSCLKLDSD
ncbi:predicted protein [Aspergillus nidulans FGSC A4]|uniref:AB hydrolase-1 domain-containing protein n=1 Tax=Emericella nidulans (strain FGSC A4 / ATCC 38163 / CBS 112.46 / NRRL 194 / M139) TaxID=227321 RepID=Q5AUP8_EMENI|nr:hypothetical protein [Aspergillus nidulans FGSC A4]EAA58785.1 predicted protein [Aspergillus nidulans FGSC A4]CBF73646.1 TPA: conserved hypothetical protein [Aspergillus nidulans FGSC A4]|eukprot:XP_681251.1 predicted protein [Aspergillus nidulans FGSC A4]